MNCSGFFWTFGRIRCIFMGNDFANRGTDMKFQIKKAAPADGQAIGDLIGEVWAGMEKKEWYVPDDGEQIRSLLETGEGIAFLAEEEETGELAGVFVVVFPGKGEKNLGREFGLSEEELPLAAHMDSAAVREKFRGFGLQRRLMETAEQALADRGIRYLFCTAHPENLYSQNNIRGLGYEAFQRKKMYGGRMRDLFVKRIPPEGCGKDAANLFSTEDKE